MEHSKRIVFIICSVCFTGFHQVTLPLIYTSSTPVQNAQRSIKLVPTNKTQHNSPRRLPHSSKLNYFPRLKMRCSYLAVKKTKPKGAVRPSVPSLNDSKCNDPTMREVIIQNIDPSPSVAKRQIQLAVHDKFGGVIDAICSSSSFSYLINTDMYCEIRKSNTTCLVFRQASQ
uniref:Ground-like domain-containing protein n=1 Tax=Setaria digitata TaxID=48799 RepID=A0A915PRA9_9BILA